MIAKIKELAIVMSLAFMIIKVEDLVITIKPAFHNGSPWNIIWLLLGWAVIIGVTAFTFWLTKDEF
jgi:hypothetical protein